MSLQKHTPSFAGQPTPRILSALQSFSQQHPSFAEGFAWLSASECTWSLAGQTPEFTRRMLPFAQANAQGALYGLWQQEPQQLEGAPIVAFGGDGPPQVIAADLKALLQLLSLDVEPFIDEDGVLYCKDEENYEPSPHIRAFRKWLRTHFQLSPISTNFEAEQLVETAQKTYGRSFSLWLQPFLTPHTSLYN